MLVYPRQISCMNVAFDMTFDVVTIKVTIALV